MTLQNYAKFNLKIIPNYFIFVYSKVFPILEPEKTARKILRGIEKGKTFVGIPFKYHFIRCMEGIFPERLFDWFFGDVFGLYTVMDHFKGRK